MHFKMSHKFSKQQARAHIEQMLNEVRGELGDKATIDEERWDGDTLNFAITTQGQHISGEALVSDSSYVIDVTLPLMLKLFEGRIQNQIEQQMKQVSG